MIQSFIAKLASCINSTVVALIENMQNCLLWKATPSDLNSVCLHVSSYSFYPNIKLKNYWKYYNSPALLTSNKYSKLSLSSLPWGELPPSLNSWCHVIDCLWGLYVMLALCVCVFVSRWWNSWLITITKCSLSQRSRQQTAFTSKVHPSGTSCCTGLRRNVPTASLWVQMKI